MTHAMVRIGSSQQHARGSARRLSCTCLALFALLCRSGVQAAPHEQGNDVGALDRQTTTLLERLADGRLEEASVLARQLTRDHPQLRLAHLVYAELQTLKALDDVRPLGQTLWSDALLDLLLEARTRLAQRLPDRTTRALAAEIALPAALVRLGDAISDVVMVDLSRSELLHFRVQAGVPTLAQRHYASSASGGYGKTREGDMKTPLGVYRVLEYRPGRTLPELYGTGALTLDYPNSLDRSLGRTGSGIWLHGVPIANASRAPWSSEGCVTMSNAHLDALVAQLDRKATVVVLTDRVDWLLPTQHAARAATRLAALPVPPGSTVIEVPRRGDPSHVAVRAANMTGADWRFIPIDVAAPGADDAVAQWTGALLP